MSVSPLPHRHHWEVRSTHLTSEGRVRYQRCICGQWQVVVVPDVDPAGGATPVGRVPASGPVGRPGG
jgi:hypothetical protein